MLSPLRDPEAAQRPASGALPQGAHVCALIMRGFQDLSGLLLLEPGIHLSFIQHYPSDERVMFYKEWLLGHSCPELWHRETLTGNVLHRGLEKVRAFACGILGSLKTSWLA